MIKSFGSVFSHDHDLGSIVSHGRSLAPHPPLLSILTKRWCCACLFDESMMRDQSPRPRETNNNGVVSALPATTTTDRC